MPARQLQPSANCRVRVVILLLAAALLAGCGSSGAGSLNAPPAASQPESSAPATTNTSGPASFVVHASTQEGDQVKVEGWFGPALPAQ